MPVHMPAEKECGSEKTVNYICVFNEKKTIYIRQTKENHKFYRTQPHLATRTHPHATTLWYSLWYICNKVDQIVTFD